MEERNLADTISYSTTIAALAKEGSKASAQRAEEILERMKSEGAELNTQTLNTGTFLLSTVFLGWYVFDIRSPAH